MSLRRVAVLLTKEIVRGPKNVIFIFALVVPLVLTLVVNLLFGTLFAGKPRLGIADAGDSQLVALAAETDSLAFTQYASAAELKDAVSTGAVDVGVVLPAGFDAMVRSTEPARLSAYVWGESLLKNRLIAGTAIAFLVRELTAQEFPLEIVTTTLGNVESIPWEERLLPFIVLMSILLGGSMVPATSLVDEKQKRTLQALTITPTSLGEVLTAKGLLGVLLSLLMAILTLILNQAFGLHPALLLLVLALGSVMAAAFGLLLGTYVKDINTLFATIKGLGILLYAPALIFLFPELPQWIAKIFPTYYMIYPVVEIVQNGAGWAEVAPELAILALLTALMLAVVAVVARRVEAQPA